MRNYKSAGLGVLVLVVAGVMAMAALRTPQEHGSNKNKPRVKSQRMLEAESQYPVADYDAPEPADPKQKEKRQAKGKKYGKSELTVDPYSDVVTTDSHWANGLPAIPIGRSAAVVVGKILDAQAYMSPNKKGVYSEFTIQIEEVLKNNGQLPLTPINSVSATRLGGRVKFASGKVGLYFVTGQGMPLVGQRYLLFLSLDDPESGFSILTGYELRDGKVNLLDNPGGGHPITIQQGADEASFINEVKAAISSP